MITPTVLVDRLRAAAVNPPGGAVMEAAAKRVAQRVNDSLMLARYPGRVDVVRYGGGHFRLVLTQTARVTRPVAGRSPKQLLHDTLAHELAVVQREIAAEARERLRG